MRKEFDLLCSRLKTDVTDSGSIHPLFEITTKSLAPWISQTSKNEDEDILETPHEGVVSITYFLIFNYIFVFFFGFKEFEEVDTSPLEGSDEEFEFIA